jgi:hypothetical protein
VVLTETRRWWDKARFGNACDAKQLYVGKADLIESETKGEGHYLAIAKKLQQGGRSGVPGSCDCLPAEE